jgi:hypothetical protein
MIIASRDYIVELMFHRKFLEMLGRWNENVDVSIESCEFSFHTKSSLKWSTVMRHDFTKTSEELREWERQKCDHQLHHLSTRNFQPDSPTWEAGGLPLFSECLD